MVFGGCVLEVGGVGVKINVYLSTSKITFSSVTFEKLQFRGIVGMPFFFFFCIISSQHKNPESSSIPEKFCFCFSDLQT